MRLQESSISVAELIDQFNRGDMVVNNEYQRQARLWPGAARSYFIDTILCGFPFPKIYVLEQLRLPQMRPFKEIVDGQQRVTTIIDYAQGRFALGKNSLQFAGRRYPDLDPEDQIRFMSYAISCDVIRDAERSDILQMFRRMNAYTLPLNEAEKRHSEFFGTFKDWVTERLEKWGRLIAEWKILSSRGIVRMEDAELIVEIALAMEAGIQSTSAAKLRKLYKTYDSEFPLHAEWANRIDETLQFIQADLSPLQSTYMTKSYAFLSLVVALIHNRWGIPGLADSTQIQPTGAFTNTPDALNRLSDLAYAHENKDLDSPYRRYVEACIAGSNRAPQRLVRAEFILKAIQGAQ
ncbi:DUF262 domain-containing protein [Stenotrophomonas maltophilia]|uniref:DUF262 domain-containing protein n=1 Tax=Stenotrophomonas maltophilia TaxID=40324 RepID=UPI002B070C98|nr:DUF262 domain-containing protein [Stenotrophomonas maltophilia]HEP1209353.1 DUF262 domain-containing protein [Stenotrophomonas maltophilia]